MKENKVSTEKLLVLLAGQSNMAGRGYAEPEDLTLIPDLLMIRPDRQNLVIMGNGGRAAAEAVTPGFIEYIRENKTDTVAGF